MSNNRVKELENELNYNYDVLDDINKQLKKLEAKKRAGDNSQSEEVLLLQSRKQACQNSIAQIEETLKELEAQSIPQK